MDPGSRTTTNLPQVRLDPVHAGQRPRRAPGGRTGPGVSKLEDPKRVPRHAYVVVLQAPRNQILYEDLLHAGPGDRENHLHGRELREDLRSGIPNGGGVMIHMVVVRRGCSCCVEGGCRAFRGSGGLSEVAP